MLGPLRGKAQESSWVGKTWSQERDPRFCIVVLTMEHYGRKATDSEIKHRGLMPGLISSESLVSQSDQDTNKLLNLLMSCSG